MRPSSIVSLLILLMLTMSLSGCTREFNDLIGGESTIVTNKNLISCNNWQEGRFWEVNGEEALEDDSCKGRGNIDYYPQMENWNLEVGDEVEYIKAGNVHCSVTITQTHLDNEEADCY